MYQKVKRLHSVELNTAGGMVLLQTSTDLSEYGFLFNMSPGSVWVGDRVFNSSVSDFKDGQPLLFGSLYCGSVVVKNSF